MALTETFWTGLIEGESHINNMRAGFAKHAAGQFVSPMVRFGGDVIRRCGEEDLHTAE
jgi:hypothetical protein